MITNRQGVPVSVFVNNESLPANMKIICQGLDEFVSKFSFIETNNRFIWTSSFSVLENL